MVGVMMKETEIFECPDCGSEMRPDFFMDTIRDNNFVLICKHINVNYLYCEQCGHKEAVDDDFVFDVLGYDKPKELIQYEARMRYKK